jgi:hypothetical protein
MHHSLSLHPPRGYLGGVGINGRRYPNDLETVCRWNDPHDPFLWNVSCWVATRACVSHRVPPPHQNWHNPFESLLDGAAGRYNGAQSDRLL